MKLLFDQNLSPTLVLLLKDIFEGSIHVQAIGLGNENDDLVWNYAKKENLIIVTKDLDFSERVSSYGFPPKVVWIRRGNCTTNTIESLLRDNYKDIIELDKNKDKGTLILW